LRTPQDFAHDDTTEFRDEYTNLNKSTLVQKSKVFNDRKLNEKECVDLLNKVCFVLNQGEDFQGQDKSSLFFNVTKLFQTNPSQH
jgi:coatomer protein complex subunit gamma